MQHYPHPDASNAQEPRFSFTIAFRRLAVVYPLEFPSGSKPPSSPRKPTQAELDSTLAEERPATLGSSTCCPSQTHAEAARSTGNLGVGSLMVYLKLVQPIVLPGYYCRP